MSKPTKQVVLTTTIRTTGKVIANRFVNHAGKQAKADEKVYGVSPYHADAGEPLAVDIVGIAVVEAGGAVAVGDDLASDAQGCAVKAGASGKAAGVARSAAAAAGDLIQIFLRG